MDKTKVKLLRDAILPVIKEKAKELEVAVDGSMNGRYDDSSVTFKFSLIDVDEKGEFESESVKNFKLAVGGSQVKRTPLKQGNKPLKRLTAPEWEPIEIPEEIILISDKYHVKVERDVTNVGPNQGACEGGNIFLGIFDDPEIELAAFFHELGHALSNELVLKRGSTMTELSGEGLAWELGLGIAYEHGYQWGYDSKEMKYARRCFISYLQSDATKLEIEQWEAE